MVRATFAGFGTALSALQANQKRLDITGQNLANMNTPGYTRQQLQTSSLNYTASPSHYTNNPTLAVGFGVRMDAVTQIRDPYLDIQYRGQIGKSGYTEAFQTALDSLSKVLDETSISGICQAFVDIQSTLTKMQDPPKVNDPVYETELRSKVEALTNLLNNSSQKILNAEKDEFSRLDGTGTSENGAVQEVNDLLRQIGTLNRQIKQTQITGQPSLELIDKRNSLLDELASYVPIEVTYFKDAEHDGKFIDPATGQNNQGIGDKELYYYDSRGNVIGKKEWPDDLKVELLYTDANGAAQRLTLVDGTEGKGDANYAKLSISAGTRDNPTAAEITVTPAASANGQAAAFSSAKGQFSSGSVQASLDMLGKNGANGSLRGYQFYMGQLDTLAKTFAKTMNNINNANLPAGQKNQYLLINKAATTNNGGVITENVQNITAANIGVSLNWAKGATHITTAGASSTDTVLDLLKAMSAPQTALGNKSFADYTSNTSTLLANDSSSNQTALTTNMTVLNGIQNSRDSISGVSMDEEATNMMSYISAYNAASRLMTTLDEALNTLINNTGVVGR